MESILDKLQQDREDTLDHWSLEEKKKVLEIYLIFSKNEAKLFDLIYRHHDCDSWEDIFRDYDTTYLQDKTKGVEIALREMNQ